MASKQDVHDAYFDPLSKSAEDGQNDGSLNVSPRENKASASLYLTAAATSRSHEDASGRRSPVAGALDIFEDIFVAATETFDLPLLGFDDMLEYNEILEAELLPP